MTSAQLTQLAEQLAAYRHWQEDRPLQLALDDALAFVIAAVAYEALELRREEGR